MTKHDGLSRRAFLATVPGLAVAAIDSAAQPANPPKGFALDRFVNVAPGFTVRLQVSKPGLVYAADEPFTAQVAATEDGFLYVFNEDAAGHVTLLFPNVHERDNRIRKSPAGEPTWVKVVQPRKNFVVRATDPGQEAVKAVVSAARLPSLEKAVEALSPSDPPVVAADDKLLARAWSELTGMEFTRAGAGDPLGRQLQFGRVTKTQEWAEHGVVITIVEKGTGAGARGVLVKLATGEPVPPAQIKPGPRRVGVFVGLNDYKAADIPRLAVAVDDAREMERALRAAGGLDDSVVLTDRDATKARVEEVLERRLELATRPGDEVVIYWSGHGGNLYDAALNPHNRPYVIPFDGVRQTDDAVRATMIHADRFAAWMQKLEGRRILVLLDTCHSGGVVNPPADQPKVRSLPPAPGVRSAQQLPDHFLADAFKGAKALGHPGLWVLAAARGNQKAFERVEGDHGVMTFYFLDAIRKLNPKGRLTIKEAADHVAAEVPRYVARKKLPGEQTPVYDGPPNPLIVIRPG